MEQRSLSGCLGLAGSGSEGESGEASARLEEIEREELTKEAQQIRRKKLHLRRMQSVSQNCTYSVSVCLRDAKLRLTSSPTGPQCEFHSEVESLEFATWSCCEKNHLRAADSRGEAEARKEERGELGEEGSDSRYQSARPR